VPRPDAPTAGKRTAIIITTATFDNLAARYALLMCQLIPIFGRNRTAEMALCSALDVEKLTVRKV
jgi:hypothetical protein